MLDLNKGKTILVYLSFFTKRTYFFMIMNSEVDKSLPKNTFETFITNLKSRLMLRRATQIGIFLWK